jgi:hypothetical protein
MDAVRFALSVVLWAGMFLCFKKLIKEAFLGLEVDYSCFFADDLDDFFLADIQQLGIW